MPQGSDWSAPAFAGRVSSSSFRKFFSFFRNDGTLKYEYKNKGGERVEQEKKWIREIQRRGSRAAADQLIRAYYDELYRFAYRQTGSKEDAMDLTQTIFLAVLRALPSYRPERSSFRTYLYRIASNKAIDARRRLSPQIVPLEGLPLEELPLEEDFAARVQDRDLLSRIESYVSGLDPQTQAVFRLRLYGEQTFPEIAAALEQPEAAVKARYYRLMGRLRKEFDPYG